VAVVVGERDAKFLEIAKRMVRLLARGRLTVLPGGHRLPLECPEALAGALAQALDPGCRPPDDRASV